MASKEEEEEAIKNDPIMKELSRSKTKQASLCLQKLSSCLLDPDLLASQAFCLFLYASCGAIAPYLPLYFKQFGLKPYQVGVIIGLAPIIQCLVSPIWAVVANKWHVQKLVFLTGVLSFVIKLLLILAVKPRKQHCLRSYVNSTSNLTYISSVSLHDALKNDQKIKWKEIVIKTTAGKPTAKPTTPAVLNHSVLENNGSRNGIPLSDWNENNNEIFRRSIDAQGSQGLPSEKDESELAKKLHAGSHFSHKPLPKPIQNYDLSVSREKRELRKVSKETRKFVPSLNATVHYVITVDEFELHNLFLILLLFVVISDFLQAPTFALGDGSVLSRVSKHYQINHSKMRITWSIGWIAAVLVVGAIVSKSVFVLCGSPRLYYSIAFYFSIGFVCMAFINALWFEYIYDQKTADNASDTCKNALKTLFDLKGTTFFLGLIYVSMCSSFLAPFLNWYIDDLGGSTLVIATTCATREAMILLSYILGNTFVSIIGRINVIVFSLISYTICFFCYWLIKNLWVVVGVVAIEGATFGLMWQSCEKHIKHLNVSPEVLKIAKGFVDALFWGIGNGAGALIGGALYGWIGSRNTFLTFGVATIVMLLVVTTMQLCRSTNKGDNDQGQKLIDDMSGNEVSGDEVARDEVSGDEESGDKVSRDEVSEDEF